MVADAELLVLRDQLHSANRILDLLRLQLPGRHLLRMQAMGIDRRVQMIEPVWFIAAFTVYGVSLGFAKYTTP